MTALVADGAGCIGAHVARALEAAGARRSSSTTSPVTAASHLSVPLLEIGHASADASLIAREHGWAAQRGLDDMLRSAWDARVESANDTGMAAAAS